MRKILAILLLGILFTPLKAEEEEGTARPKVGVVLSGGGAKGVAHIGALKVLEDLDIPVDYIVGTSIGSIVGGMYALGYNASELDSLLGHQDWGKLIQDNVHRRERLYEDKQLGDKLILRIPFMTPRTFRDEAGEANPGGKKPLLSQIPSGVVEGHNLDQLFTAVSVGYQDSVDFNSLPIPFACVAIDLNTKKEVVFRSGNIVEAIRASMAIPGFFAPVRKDGMYLVDGGMANNFPVDVAREMGADIVIGVDLHAYDKAIVKPVENVGDLFGNLLNLMNGRKYNEGRSAADILICPDTGSYGILDFNEKVLTALVDSGYVAAQRQRAALEDLAREQKEAGYDGRRFTGGKKAIDISKDSVFVSQISISGADPEVTGRLLEDSGILPGTMVSGEQMQEVIDDFFRTRAFSKVSYSMAGQGDQYNLKIKFSPEKLHELGLGFRFDTDEMAAILVNLSLNKHKISGWKASLSGKLAQSPYLSLTGSYAFNNNWQLNLNAYLSDIDTDIYSGNLKILNADIGLLRAQFDLQCKGRNFELLLGAKGFNAKYRSVMLSPDYAAAFKKGYFWQSLSAFASFGFDSRDNAYFPQRGISFNLCGNVPVLYGDNENKYTQPYLDHNSSFLAVIPLGRKLALIPQVYSRFIFISEDINTQMASITGSTFGGYEKDRRFPGHLPFVGLNHTYHGARFTTIGRADLRYNFYKNHYVTAAGNVLFTAERLKEVYKSKPSVGLALGYSLDTFLGPLGLTLHWSDLNKGMGLYLTFGYRF